MSGRLLHAPSLFHILQDDFESFFYLVLFVSLCLFKTNLAEHKTIIDNVFADSTYDYSENAYVGGAHKQLLISQGWYISKPPLIFIGNAALTSWITTTRLALRSYYSLEYDAAELALITEELSPDHPLYEDKKAWDNLLVKDYQAMKNAFEKALNEDGWSTAKPGKSPFEGAPRFQNAT